MSAVDVVCIGECCSCRIGEPDVLLCTFRFSRKYRQCNGENHKFEGKFNIIYHDKFKVQKAMVIIPNLNLDNL